MDIYLDLDRLLRDTKMTPTPLTESPIDTGVLGTLLAAYEQATKARDKAGRAYNARLKELITDVIVKKEPRGGTQLIYRGKIWRLSAPKARGYGEVLYTLTLPDGDTVKLLHKPDNGWLPAVEAIRVSLASTAGAWRPENMHYLSVTPRLYVTPTY